jgi:hypothetical protein
MELTSEKEKDKLDFPAVSSMQPPKDWDGRNKQPPMHVFPG